MSTNPFDYVKSISYTKENLIHGSDNVELAEKDYSAFLVNRAFSYFVDTIADANEMNRLHFLPARMQYSYLINNIRPKRRFSKWNKKKKSSDLEAVQEYYDFSINKAKTALTILNEFQIKSIKEQLEKGG